MRVMMMIGGAIAVVSIAACSDAAPTRTTATGHTDWSGAVIEVAATNPNARGELRGVVLDSAGVADPSKGTPIPGVTVELNLKVIVQPSSGTDTAWTTVTKVGEVVTDANGRFLVTAIPEGDYYVVATPPSNAPYFGGATWAFVSSGSSAGDATIFLPHRSETPPPDSLTPPGNGHPIDPPMEPPVDSM